MNMIPGDFFSFNFFINESDLMKITNCRKRQASYHEDRCNRLLQNICMCTYPNYRVSQPRHSHTNHKPHIISPPAFTAEVTISSGVTGLIMAGCSVSTTAFTAT